MEGFFDRQCKNSGIYRIEEENAKFIKEHGSDIIDALSGFSDINASENSKESDSPNIDIEKLKELLK